MIVHNMMTDSVVSVTPSTSFTVIWKIMFQHKVNALPVTDQHKKLLGIISKDDLLAKLYPDYLDLVEDFTNASDFNAMEEKFDVLKNVTAQELMNPRVIFTREDTPAMRALSRMIAQKVNQLPVLDEKDRLSGMVTKGDVFYALFKKHEKSVGVKKRVAAV